MKILAIDSSAKTASVAIIEEKVVLAEYFINAGLTHSQTLMPMVESILKNTNTDIKNINIFAISSGPGSFTGLRIGMACIKGLALFNKIPCIEVSTLHSMVYNFCGENAIICAVMDARANQVYNAIFDIDDEKITRLTSDRIILIEDLFYELKNFQKKVILVGDGAVLCYNKLKNNLNLNVAYENKRFQKASGVAFAAHDLYLKNKNNITSAENLVPKYLIASQAERELNKKLFKEKSL